ncbi:tripartite tricarboxylate transporter TctB family protein [Peptoniphilus sp. SGI.035]|uniref:tripartite tricarboxylate transporter TctB family protein n=1 Tax=Peptoniphilus sp. SGI.035 TaxID=3420564 RepID=UPI003D016C64
MKKYLKLDTIISFILILIATILLNITREFPERSALFPRLILISMIIFSVLVIIESIIKDTHIKKIGKEKFKNVVIITILIIGYYIISKILGLIIGTLLFILVSTKFLGENKFLRALLIGIAFNVMIYLVFVKFLSVPIPYRPIFM